jgi:mannan endo-1,4-beta-mannosidase
VVSKGPSWFLLQLEPNDSRYLIDYIELSPSEPRPPHNINANLVNSNANADAKALYSYLISIYGKKILSGQQDLTWADWIEEKIGKIPALVSVDLMDYSPSRVEHGTVGTSIEEAITHAGRGGIISVLWHWNAPTGLYDTDENPWWSGFYTRKRTTKIQVLARYSVWLTSGSRCN